ncbi:helicase-related protein [Qipengyuania zhejiangensis]|uniref:helicase-related protein n=1 Tax=Qipengyuania zhejiangensis TaxID=3077782 RepID=UPI002D76F3E7|nr:helicase-related protein [Qipengyuania sp. Z2]
MHDSAIKAVLGPTNTGKTHLAIERMCAHSSGTMGFPLRLLAREVYDRVRAIKGDAQVALITGEERIEPKGARYLCCTMEAMPRNGANAAFVALDEAQLGADRERGHIFTDRLLNTRGREETMILGAATLAPLVRELVPEAEISDRPRFSTLTHIGPRKLSRLPPRSAIVAFSAEAVYSVAEMLRRFRGGAAVVMGALSPETRNKQVELFQNGEVDYIVATDAVGMGLNLDVNHVAFAGLGKFDGVKMRRLLPAEMAQIAGRAGRHQRDGTFGTLAGQNHGGSSPEFTEEEIYAIEEHRFAPLTHLYWRDPEPRFDSLAALIADLEASPSDPVLRLGPEAIDLATLKRLAEDPVSANVRTPGMVRRFWEACSLPDFRKRGPDVHARFVARLWQDLSQGYLGADYVAARISELDNMAGDIDTLQGRIAAIRSWAYICQRPDWVLARDEMASRARAVEAKLSDALHARLTERFVNRRTAILMKSLGEDASMLPIELGADGSVTVEGETLGSIEGFRFVVDPQARHEDRRMLLAAAEKALPRLLGKKAEALAASDLAEIELSRGTLRWRGQELATLETRDGTVTPLLHPSREVQALPEGARTRLVAALEGWLATRLAPLDPLDKLHKAAVNPDAGSQARALLLNLLAGHGYISRERAGIEHLPKEMRPFLRKIGVTFGALDIFAPALLKPAPRQVLSALGIDRRPLNEAMVPTIPGGKKMPAGYRAAGEQAIRIDLAEKILRAAHEARAKAQGKPKGKAKGKDRHRTFPLDMSLPISIGLEEGNIVRLLGVAGFRVHRARPLADGAFGPPRPDLWEWRPSRRKQERKAEPRPVEGSAFAALADLVR